MPIHERNNSKKQDEAEKKHHLKKQKLEPLSEQDYTHDKGANQLGGSIKKPGMDKHSAILANSHSEREIVDFTRQLQHVFGNGYVQRLVETMKLQPKLSVSQPDDIYEQEADRIAKEITRAPDSGLGRQPEEEEEEELQMKPAQLQRQEEEEEELQMKPAQLQRQEEEEELQMKPAQLQRQEEEEEELQMKPAQLQRQEEEEELQMKPAQLQRQEEEELQMKPAQLQRQEEEEELQMKPAQLQRQEEEEELQMKAETGVSSPVSKDIEMRIGAVRGNGESLSETVRAPLETGLGHNFGQVRVHTNAEANELSRQLGAKAFTTESDIFFGENAYQPDTTSGRELITHELTHVVQQQAAPVLKPQEETGLTRIEKTSKLQRQDMPEEEEELQAKPASLVQRQEEEEEEELLQARTNEDSTSSSEQLNQTNAGEQVIFGDWTEPRNVSPEWNEYDRLRTLLRQQYPEMRWEVVDEDRWGPTRWRVKTTSFGEPEELTRDGILQWMRPRALGPRPPRAEETAPVSGYF